MCGAPCANSTSTPPVAPLLLVGVVVGVVAIGYGGCAGGVDCYCGGGGGGGGVDGGGCGGGGVAAVVVVVGGLRGCTGGVRVVMFVAVVELRGRGCAHDDSDGGTDSDDDA